MTFDEWLAVGVEQGWVSLPVCQTHEGSPMTNEEMELWEDSDPCIHILRIWSDDTREEGL